MSHRKSTSSTPVEDPLSLAAVRKSSQSKSQPKPRSKSSASVEQKMNEHFSGVFRVGRMMASIFDRGRRMKYDYHVPEKEAEAPRNPALANAYADTVGIPASIKSSRTSSTATVSTTAGTPINTTSTGASSRRDSSESMDGKRQRRGGMSVN